MKATGKKFAGGLSARKSWQAAVLSRGQERPYDARTRPRRIPGQRHGAGRQASRGTCRSRQKRRPVGDALSDPDALGRTVRHSPAISTRPTAKRSISPGRPASRRLPIAALLLPARGLRYREPCPSPASGFLVFSALKRMHHGHGRPMPRRCHRYSGLARQASVTKLLETGRQFDLDRDLNDLR